MKKLVITAIIISLLCSCATKRVIVKQGDRRDELADKTSLERNEKQTQKGKHLMRFHNIASYPVWFYDPHQDGYLGAVGIAKKQEQGGYYQQKWLARIVAEQELTKQRRILINNICNSRKEIQLRNEVIIRYKSKINCKSEQYSKAILKTTIKDEWIDPQTGDLYLWVVIE